MVIEKITRITSEPLKAKSSYGNWKVLADVDFYSEETGKSWSYPNKNFYFFTKTRALEFIKSYLK